MEQAQTSVHMTNFNLTCPGYPPELDSSNTLLTIYLTTAFTPKAWFQPPGILPLSIVYFAYMPQGIKHKVEFLTLKYDVISTEQNMIITSFFSEYASIDITCDN